MPAPTRCVNARAVNGNCGWGSTLHWEPTYSESSDVVRILSLTLEQCGDEREH